MSGTSCLHYSCLKMLRLCPVPAISTSCAHIIFFHWTQYYIKQIKKGNEKHVVTLIRLLTKKGKLGMLDEVMAEFSRICDELNVTKVVVVGPSKIRGDATEFERIAREVQRTSGANRVKVRRILSI
jgi:ATP synthase delta (OSCP) subunit